MLLLVFWKIKMSGMLMLGKPLLNINEGHCQPPSSDRLY